MADKTGEQLSTLVDCECDAAELDLALRRLAKDEALKARWQRYHLIGDTIKNNLPEVLDARFSERIRQAVETGPPIHETPPASAPLAAWYKPVAGFALAASVALVTVLALEPPFSSEVAPDPVADAGPAPVFRPESLAGLALAGTPAQARLAGYLVNHSEYASMNSVRGVVPYVYMVGYQTNP